MWLKQPARLEQFMSSHCGGVAQRRTVVVMKDAAVFTVSLDIVFSCNCSLVQLTVLFHTQVYSSRPLKTPKTFTMSPGLPCVGSMPLHDGAYDICNPTSRLSPWNPKTAVFSLTLELGGATMPMELSDTH
jgi:hypothetical protein